MTRFTWTYSISTINDSDWVPAGSGLVGLGGVGVSVGSVRSWSQFIGQGYRAAAGPGEVILDIDSLYAGGAINVGKGVSGYGDAINAKLLTSDIPPCTQS